MNHCAVVMWGLPACQAFTGGGVCCAGNAGHMGCSLYSCKSPDETTVASEFVIKRWAGTRSFQTQWGSFISFIFCQTNRNEDEDDCLWGRRETNPWHPNTRRRGVFSSARSDCKRKWFSSTCRLHPQAVINGHSTPWWTHKCPCRRSANVKTNLLSSNAEW